MPLVEGKLTGYFDPGCVLVTLFDSVCPVPSAGENMDARCEATRDSDLMQRDIPLLEFVRLGGRYLDKLKRIRETEDKKERSFLKRKLLPAATISATMLTRAGNLDLDKKINHYNGLVVLDFDDVEDIEGAKMKLGLLPYVWYVSLSASGRGLYAIIPTENTDYRLHKVYFEALCDEMERIGLIADRPCSDVTRLRFVSFDDYPCRSEYCEYFSLPEEVLREAAAEQMHRAVKDLRSCEVERARMMADEWVDKQIALDDFRDWYVMASALSTIGEEGWKILDMISQFGAKYDREKNREIFERLGRTNRSITMGSFYYKCHEYGVLGNLNEQVETVPFPVEAFPEAVQEIISKAHEGMNHPVDYIASSLIAVAAAAIGNSIQVLVMADWIEKPIIYMAIVGEAGTNKSAPLEFAVRPLEAVDDVEMEKYNEEYRKYEEELDKAMRTRGALPEPPAYKQIVLNDFTIEAMMQQHTVNPRGMLVYKDELLNFIRNMSRYSTGNDEMTWTSMFNGGNIQNTRKDKRKTKLKNTCVSICGTIQPEALPEFAKGKTENGFIDRWLYAYPDSVKSPKFKPGRQMPEIVDEWSRIINRILAVDYDKDDEPIILNAEAELVFATWYNALAEQKDRAGGVFRKAATKMERYCIRFAIILEALRYGAGGEPVTEITAWAIKGAIDLVCYYLGCGMKARSKFRASPLEGMSELQKNVYRDIPVKFETKEGMAIAEKHGMSSRTFQNWLRTDYFIKNAHGIYERRYR